MVSGCYLPWFWGLLYIYFLKKGISNLNEAELVKLSLIKAELEAVRSQMNPHFMFNTLNSIQNYILKNDKETASKYLGDFARLMRNTLKFSKIRIYIFT